MSGELSFSQIALFETNVVSNSGFVASMSIVTGISLAVTIYCVTNPKACFGSCPTFYVPSEDGPFLAAEGFSSSIAPSLEAVDVDAVGTLTAHSQTMSVTMKNEAFETHVVRRADLKVFPARSGEHILAVGDGQFVRANKLRPADAVWDSSRDWTEECRDFDGVWRSVPADSFDLGARETLQVDFDLLPESPAVLSVSGRQSLMTTFLFYQGLSWMGSTVGEWLARLETLDPSLKEKTNGIGDALGRIEVWEEREDGQWVAAGACGETGPLATDTWGVVLPELAASAPQRTGRFELRATQGLWRIDAIRAGALLGAEEPIHLPPTEVFKNGEPNSRALENLNNNAESLVSLPGDSFDLVYSDARLTNGEYETFVESEGYYWEWMRNEWLEEENPAKFAKLLFNPRQTLVDLAAEYKEAEPGMERAFWGSQYVRP